MAILQYSEDKKVSDKEMAWARLSHLISFIGLIAFVISIAAVTFEVFIRNNLTYLPILLITVAINSLIPYFMWKRIRKMSRFVDAHSKAALNFQLSVTLYFIISIAAVFIIIGIIMLFVLVLFDISSIIDANKKAREGEDCRYTMSINFIS